jgi:hypothetical protein
MFLFASFDVAQSVPARQNLSYVGIRGTFEGKADIKGNDGRGS